MKNTLVVALSFLYVSLASAQSVPFQDTTSVVTGTPKVTAQNGQSIGLVNTAVYVKASVASVGDGCEIAGTLTLRGKSQPFVCSRTKHWIPVNAAQTQ
jgi:hypothetical protein